MIGKIKDENGEVVIEATIIVSLTLIATIFLIYLGFVIYQQTFMQVVANETASSIAQVYSSSSKDPIYGYIGESELYKTELYRNLTNIITKSQDKVNKKKGEWYAYYRLKKGTLMNLGDPTVEVSFENKKIYAWQKQVVVTIKDTLKIPIAKLWGMSGELNIEVRGRADCQDLFEYINLVDTANSTIKDIEKNLGLDGVGDIVNKIYSFVDKWQKNHSGEDEGEDEESGGGGTW